MSYEQNNQFTKSKTKRLLSYFSLLLLFFYTNDRQYAAFNDIFEYIFEFLQEQPGCPEKLRAMAIL